MEYRRLGRAGLKVSVLSFGSWVTFGEQVGLDVAEECLTIARDAGVNFIDTAEAYAGGEAEKMLGAALEELGWPRETYVLSTKLFWGIYDQVNLRHTLNRKYLMQGIDRCLERLRTPFVDVLFCHRHDPQTPMEEIVWAMSDIVASGKALYWGTSMWPADEIRAAFEVAERYGLRKPIVEQPEYNLFARERVEREYAGVLDELGIGLTTWSPLASGVLTGKYLDGIPEHSRAALPGFARMRDSFTDAQRNKQVAELAAIAQELGCSTGQLAVAWCARNPAVSTVILGASNPDQLRENLGALDVLPALTDEVATRIDQIFRLT